MSDIDFEELDRAVNSLVGDNKTGSESARLDPSRPLHKAEHSPDAVAASAPQKHSGSLIDVVHHPNSVRAPHKSVTQGAKRTLTPLNSAAVHEHIKKSSHSLPEFTDASKVIEDLGASATASDWPDPLDMPDSKNTEPNKESASENVSEVPEINMPDSLDEETSSDDNSYQPLTSPFIDGTKVEKRPLGLTENKHSLKQEKDSSADDSETPQETISQSKKENYQEDSVAADLLRPEFEETLVKIESDETAQALKRKEPEGNSHYSDIVSPHTAPKPTPPPPLKSAQEEPLPELKKSPEPTENLAEPKLAEPEKKPASAVPATALLASNSVVSIPQQYKKTSSGSEPHTDQPLFNAEHYQQPPSGAQTGHSSGNTTLLQWVFIVVGLLLLGAVLGTVVFVLVTGQSL